MFSRLTEVFGRFQVTLPEFFKCDDIRICSDGAYEEGGVDVPKELNYH